MNKRTLEALKGSVEKWWKIRYEDGVDNGRGNCPLCSMGGFACTNCVVEVHTGERFCMNTPYEHWINHQQKHYQNWGLWAATVRGIKAQCPTCKRFATMEYNFLKSLLPKGEQ